MAANTIVDNLTVGEELNYFPFGAIMQHQYALAAA